jgi:hypothetical protein
MLWLTIYSGFKGTLSEKTASMGMWRSGIVNAYPDVP